MKMPFRFHNHITATEGMREPVILHRRTSTLKFPKFPELPKDPPMHLPFRNVPANSTGQHSGRDKR